ncbi:DUF72 domain-containing protein [Altericista sp. CCNU0014]|uniref:DUF72 domain-containing protein n=1 Tax=Altericista sp. CCNU0014 TaxID=3082949 RepID=UPI00384F8B6C
MSFKLGCAIWAYKGWIGDVFPPGTSASKFLQLYSQRFATVECNATFYSVPAAETIARWVRETPSGFEFCPKFPRSITHEGALQPKIDDALRFIALMQGLGDRLGPLFVQLPPNYGPQSFSDLEAFLKGLHACGVPLALEVRHPQWFNAAPTTSLNSLLQSLSIGRVLLDSRPVYECDDNPEQTAARRKPRLPLQPAVTAPFAFIRYISHPDRFLNREFMMGWASDLQNWLQQGKSIYLFVHCPVEEHSPQNARYFQQLLEERSVPIPPLEWEIAPPPPVQLDLF